MFPHNPHCLNEEAYPKGEAALLQAWRGTLCRKNITGCLEKESGIAFTVIYKKITCFCNLCFVNIYYIRFLAILTFSDWPVNLTALEEERCID